MALLRCAPRITCAYVAGIIIAAIGFIEGILDLVSGASAFQMDVAFQAISHLFVGVAVMSGLTALLPTVIVGFFAVRAGLCSVFWYPVLGAVVGLGATAICFVLFRLSYDVPLLDQPNAVYLIIRFATAAVLGGICGGLVFGTIVGRTLQPAADDAGTAKIGGNTQ